MSLQARHSTQHVPSFWLVAVFYGARNASSMAQDLLKLTAALASWFVIASFWMPFKLLTILGKLPIKYFRGIGTSPGKRYDFQQIRKLHWLIIREYNG